MSILNGLRTAKFRNTSFLYDSSSVKLGRKTVTHEFVKSDSRLVEDLGRSQKVITVKAIIFSNNKTEYNKLKETFEKEFSATAGAGRLIIPTYNQDFNVVAKSAVVNEDITSLNVAEYNVSFEETDLNKFPVATDNKLNAIAGLATTAQKSVKSFFDDIYESEFFASIKSAQEDLRIVTGAITDIIGRTEGFVDIIGGIQRDITDLNNSIFDFIATPASLSTRLNNIFNNFKLMTSNFADLFDKSNELIGLETSDLASSQFSRRGKSIADNSTALTALTEVNALIISYQAAVNISYSNQEELNDVVDSLNANFQIVAANVDYDSLLILEEIRNAAQSVFDDLRITLPNIVEVNLISQPITTLVYKYYGSLDNDDAILGLNNIEDPAFVQGNIKLISNI